MDKNKRIITVLMILTIVFTIIGGTLAYWSWRTTDAQKTNITFTITSDFSCSADGGGDITSGSINLVPTIVNDTTTGNYIKREIKVTPTINTTGKTVYMDLWLDIKTLGSGLSGTDYFKYSFTTGASSPEDGVVYSGNFRGLVKNNRVRLLLDKEYTSSMTDTYYLWIWLDAKETDSDTMNQSFHLVLNGNCTDMKVEPNAPVLGDGLVPIVFDTSNGTVIKTISNTDASWYDYSRQEWANAVLVKTSGTQTRAYYKANPGVAIDESDILAYYVWIPRYKYKIWTLGESSQGQEQTIDIVFESTDSISTGTQVGEYITHPAFWWDNDSDGVRDSDEELSGIWVGKFETTGTADSPTILPDVQSLTDQNVSTQFATAQKLGGTTYGVSSSSDSHMMKNSEWGAATYLSHSKYGVNREVYINNSTLKYTGRSGGNVVGSTPINETYTDQSVTLQLNKYGYYTWDGYLLNYNTNTKSSIRDLSKVASTTGNITGVYDVYGISFNLMSVFANSDGQLWSGNNTLRNSGFTGLVGSSGESYTGIAFPDSKYYDVYKATSGTTISALTACDGGVCYGHGLSETEGWYISLSSFVESSYPWMVRGSVAFQQGRYAGGIFSYLFGSGAGDGFRSVLSSIGA